jgi:hypothetical protein
MTGLFVSAAMAFAATMIFAFQFSYWDSRRLLGGVFLLLFVADLIATSFLPEGVLHPVVGLVCLGMGLAIFVAHRVIEQVSAAERESERRGDAES